MFTVNLAIMIPFLAAALVPLFRKRTLRIHIGWFVFLVPAALFVYLLSYIPSVSSGETFVHTIKWIPSFDINFTTYLDGLSLIFALLITGIGALVTIYSIYYLSSNENLKHFYAYLLLFMGAMLGVVFSDNMMVMYVFWELTSVSSFLLIAFWYHRKRSREGAQKSLLITVSGGFGILAGFLMLYAITGTMSIREVIHTVSVSSEHALFVPAMFLILLGAFTKSAQFPFHIWLPSAMEAPTPVSAYLHSATMVKAGIFLVARFTPVFGGEALWLYTVTSIGLITLFWGSFNAIRQTDLKALLAYSTISQLGMIMSMFGLGSAALQNGASSQSVFYTQAAFAAVFHLINHSTFKGALFMVVGIIDHELGTRDIRRLGGLASLMPITFTIATIGSFSMAGLPPFNGFLSKEMFFTSVLRILEFDATWQTWVNVIPYIAWIASVLTFVYCLLFVVKTFFGEYKEEKLEHPAHEAPYGMLFSPSILAVLVVLIFFFPNVLGEHLITPAMASVFPTIAGQADLGVHISQWHGFNTELFMTIGVVVAGIVLYLTLPYWKKVYQLFPEKWSFNQLYSNILEQTEKRSKAITNSYMTAYLQDYMTYIYLFFILAVGGLLISSGSYIIDIKQNNPISAFEWIIAISMMIAAISILFSKSRLTAILVNSFLGYGVAIFFVIFRAPDLALTQTVVETVTTVLFLAAYYFLPDWKKEKEHRRSKGLQMAISIAVGTIFTITALAVQNGKLFDSISSYYENSYELAGGKNIVNAILGDFRAFDTMLEVVVLLIAGIGIYAIINLKDRKGDAHIEDK
ncbi:Na+/H+ antiporter subunit A [Oceanobacillus piezotolerans]|uniref:Na+/H+ antiporter subunit A n=1 Tax=Oceanobacillus piezotolerans TaxID=2448030 RepID=A0A498D8V8_9BACI|nr:Na+/H+ antiporter subunit A [Oceanobacillus piezotolerans]RLL42726.1 Na+/H+ antiporter subunit A [Oceanobacillus piezotolerans]